MYLAYYDESGDDGFPEYSSPLFALTCVYLRDEDWNDAFTQLRQFRRDLKAAYGLPVKTEFHTKQFLWNKKPYREFGLSEDERVEIVDLYCDAISKLPVSIVNVVINKTIIRSRKYRVLDKALTYSIQRVENDLTKNDADNRFLLITDPGRIGKMSRTAREKRAINYIPSKIYVGQSYRQEIKLLIEDPLPKDSKSSFFIQTADLVAHVVYLHTLAKLGIGSYSPRLPQALTPKKAEEWLLRMIGSLNIDASGPDPYGVVVYPKTP